MKYRVREIKNTSEGEEDEVVKATDTAVDHLGDDSKLEKDVDEVGPMDEQLPVVV